jgi:hypothetical protein
LSFSREDWRFILFTLQNILSQKVGYVCLALQHDPRAKGRVYTEYSHPVRCNVVGQDLNRAWAETNKFLHSEILEIKKQLVYYDNHSESNSKDQYQDIPAGKYDLDMVLDIHAHTALTGLFVYGNSYDDVYRCAGPLGVTPPSCRYERHIVFPKVLAQNCDDFNCNNTIYNADQKKSGSVRRHMPTYLSHEANAFSAVQYRAVQCSAVQVNTYTIEVSMLGYEDTESRQIIPYTDDLYAKVQTVSTAVGSECFCL